MANPTAGVKVLTVPVTEEIIQWPLASTAQTYYPNEAIGLNTSGYATKFDDSASLLFLGLNAELVQKQIESGGSNGDTLLSVVRPKRFSILLSSVAITDVGKLAYAAYSNEAQLTTGTYGNVFGRIVKKSGTNYAEVEPFPLNQRGCGAARTLAATGAQTITKYDLNKVMFCANTAALTLTLPAVADTQPGDTLTFVKSHASDTNAITLDGNASETIDGATTLATLDAPYDTAILVSTGAAWIVLARDIA